MLFIDLTDIAPVPPYLTSGDDLAQVLAAAEDILATTPAQDLREIMADWHMALSWTANAADEAWYVRALLLTCVVGLLGDRAPKTLRFPCD